MKRVLSSQNSTLMSVHGQLGQKSRRANLTAKTRKEIRVIPDCTMQDGAQTQTAMQYVDTLTRNSECIGRITHPLPDANNCQCGPTHSRQVCLGMRGLLTLPAGSSLADITIWQVRPGAPGLLTRPAGSLPAGTPDAHTPKTLVRPSQQMVGWLGTLGLLTHPHARPHAAPLDAPAIQ